METAVQEIPEQLIYEMVDGKPIYYKNYREYLEGVKQIEELMGSSLLQSLIISRLVFFLQLNLGSDYEVLTNEVGIQFEKKSWRAAAIAIAQASEVDAAPAMEKYLNFAPEVVIEIDTKAELRSIENPLGYYHEKTDELLKFGVKKVIWIFTDTRKVMVARRNEKWETSGWDQEIEVMDGLRVKIEDLLKRKK